MLLLLALASCATCGQAFAPPSAALSRASAGLAAAQRGVARQQQRQLRMAAEQPQVDTQSPNEKLFYDPNTGRFYEKEIQEVRHRALTGCGIELDVVGVQLHALNPTSSCSL